MKCPSIRSLILVALAVLATNGHAQDSTSVGSASHKHTIISRDVLVEDGDTLASLARRELGKTGLAPLLAEYNKLTPTTQLVPGSIIRIPVQVPKRDEFAEVVFVKGTVTATRLMDLEARATLVSASHASDVVDINDGAQQPGVITLSRNAHVYSGDIITTSIDGYLSIAFSSGSVINLQPDTIAKLERLTCLESDDSCLIEINTQRGRVTSDVESRDQQPVEFRINTPYASAAVRGTVFDVDASQKLLVGVSEGLVDISAQSETVPLNSGFGLVVEEGEPPGEPIELIPGPVFKRVPSRVAIGDTIEWWPFNDATSYLAVVSSDEAANETLTDLSLPQGSNLLDVKATLDEPLDAGDYFLTLRAVDINGLLGLTSNTRFTLADIDPTINAVSTNVERQGSEFLVTVVDRPEEAIGYEIQIANDEDFTDPLSVDVNATGTAVFRLDEDQVFTRARILLDPFTVSAFGEPTSN